MALASLMDVSYPQIAPSTNCSQDMFLTIAIGISAEKRGALGWITPKRIPSSSSRKCALSPFINMALASDVLSLIPRGHTLLDVSFKSASKFRFFSRMQG